MIMNDDCELWQKVATTVLTPEIPFTIHEQLYALVYEQRQPNNPGPAWFPDPQQVAASNLHKFMVKHGFKDYAALHAWAKTDYAEYWQAIITELGIKFIRPYTDLVKINNIEKPEWLVNAKLNIASSCFQENNAKSAIIYQDHTGKLNNVSYGELDVLSNRVANGLGRLGLVVGDVIAIDLPMTVEAVAIYLGIVKAGCVVAGIADSFAPQEIATRLNIANAKAIFTQDVLLRANKSLPLYEKVVKAQAPRAIVLTEASVALRPGDITWEEFLVAEPQFTAVACEPHQHMNILFSSGTTGTPKAIPWDHTAPIKAAADGYVHQDIQAPDVVCWPTNLGWMMGPWLIYATFINKATLALCYDVPTSREFIDFVERAKVTILGVVPSIVKYWRHNQLLDNTYWQHIRLFTSTGEASNSSDMLFLMSRAKYKPVIEYCGGTEISGAYVTSTVLQPNIPATFSTPALGLDLVLIDDHGQSANPGEVSLIPPSIGLSRELLNADHHQIYYDMPAPPGVVYRRHGDQLEKLANNYMRALGRVDDTMNIGAIKVSSAEIERSLLGVDPNVLETAAIAVEPAGGGPSMIVIYAVPVKNDLGINNNVDLEQLKAKMQQAINTQLNPLFKISEVIFIDALPRTSSNKVMRRVLRDRYMNRT